MSRIRESARGEQCQIRIYQVCNHDPETTVLCHPNELGSGHGMGHKGIDELGAYGCFNCHNVYDRRVPLPAHLTRLEVENAFHRGHQRTFVILREKGLI